MPVIHGLHREPGKVAIDHALCRECCDCTEVCPTRVVTVKHGGTMIDRANLIGCIGCGHCIMVCKTGAISVTGRDISREDLLPLPENGEKATPDGLAALMRGRRSVRSFQERAVDPAIIDRIIEMASSAPIGIPPWDVGCARIEGREAVKRVAGEVALGYRGMLRILRPWVLAALRPFLGRARYELFRTFILPLARTIVEAHREGRDTVFWGAPAVLIFHRSARSTDSDAAIPCTYAMLAAESLGLGSTMIGSAPPMIARNRRLCRRLGIPDGNVPSLALILGHPAVAFRRAVRRRFAPGPRH